MTTDIRSTVLLASMPFGVLDRPALGLSLLAPAARAAGFECTTKYFGFQLAERIGTAVYQWLSYEVPYESFAGEWLFADALYGPNPARNEAFMTEVLRDRFRLDDTAIRTIDGCRATCTRFIEDVAAANTWSDYSVIGFTSTFQQNLASLALAKRVKQLAPDSTLVFGGANWEAEMGQALHESFPFVDVVCPGEADHTFPNLLDALASAAPLSSVGGIVYREHGRTVTTPSNGRIEHLDDLPQPDFAPYFDDLATSAAADEVAPIVLLETARGCWWGAQHHCTFCGLNGESMAFRSKSPGRVLEEIDSITTTWGVHNVSVVDNILDMRYFRTVLPELAAHDHGCTFFWETKASLSRKQVALLAAAGVNRIQPGIESLINDVLDRMRKGTTFLQNLALLKWCREYGVAVEWNVLYGFPGESIQDYVEMAGLFDRISHLPPPTGFGGVRLDRFSPYHEDPEAWDLHNVRAATPYRHLYPFDSNTVDRVAYYFDFDYGDGRDPHKYIEPVGHAINRWKRVHAQSGLWLVDQNETSVTVVDERLHRRTVTLEGWKASVTRACDRARTVAYLREIDEVASVPPDELSTFLDRCVATGLMASDGGSYLSLAVNRPARIESVPRPRRQLEVIGVA